MTAPPPGFCSSGDGALDARYRWAKASLDAGEAAEAREILLQTLAQAPAWAPAWKLLADAHLRCAEEEEARQAYEQALRLDPQDRLGARLDLARLRAIAGEGGLRAGYVAAISRPACSPRPAPSSSMTGSP